MKRDRYDRRDRTDLPTTQESRQLAVRAANPATVAAIAARRSRPVTQCNDEKHQYSHDQHYFRSKQYEIHVFETPYSNQLNSASETIKRDYGAIPARTWPSRCSTLTCSTSVKGAGDSPIQITKTTRKASVAISRKFRSTRCLMCPGYPSRPR